MRCRHCNSLLQHTFLDLGFAPPSNAYVLKSALFHAEKYYPLRVMVCETCWLLQTEDYAKADELFSSDYAYFSSVSSTWTAHAAKYAQKVIDQLNLNNKSMVLEIGSNDGYLLKNFLYKNIPCLGVEPTISTAHRAMEVGIPVVCEFFSHAVAQRLLAEGYSADLIVGNNVFAHVPDINDFANGMKKLLKSDGVITLEFPNLASLIEYGQFDTVYHEHYSYLSLYTTNLIFKSVGLRIWDVEKLSTHGGSLRIYGCHANDDRKTLSAVDEILNEEFRLGLQQLATYQGFQARANRIKDELLGFLIDQKRAGKRVAAYGAAAKGNTLLNYAGVKSDLLQFVCDASYFKQGKYLPGSHIPIVSPKVLFNQSLDYLLILPWNLQEEIKETQAYLIERKCKFVVAIPTLKIFS
jgi:hypothetical protein